MTDNSCQGDFNKLLQTLQCQFLCCYPVKNIKWEQLTQHLTWKQQELLLKSTRGHDLNKEYPIKLDYQLNFLKNLIQSLERNTSEVHDDIYNEYCNVQQLTAQSTDDLVYKHYLLPEFDVHITLQEAKTFVSKGTTGLCTWQASLALAEFLLLDMTLHGNRAYISNRNVIELGAGTGACGMILTACAAPYAMNLTDGSQECVDLMLDNLESNFGSKAKRQADGFFKLHRTEQYIGAFLLPWEQAEEFQFSKQFTPDLILAADVIYDDALFEDLVHAIDVVFKKAKSHAKMLLAATVRNEATLEAFLKLISKNYLVKQCDEVPESASYLQWDRTTSVRIFEITLNNFISIK